MISLIHVLLEREPLHLHLAKGALHRELKVPEGEKIPKEKLAIKPSDTEHEKKQKRFAEIAAKWNHKGPK